VGQPANGKVTVMVKMRLACEKNATFYNYRTDGSVMVDGNSLIAWDNKKIPGSYWGDSASLTEDGVTYRRYVDLQEGTIEVPADSTEREVIIAASWQRLSISSTPPSYLPSTTVAYANIPVLLPAAEPAEPIESTPPVPVD
jgi:hypothetical protein